MPFPPTYGLKRHFLYKLVENYRNDVIFYGNSCENIYTGC